MRPLNGRLWRRPPLGVPSLSLFLPLIRGTLPPLILPMAIVKLCYVKLCYGSSLVPVWFQFGTALEFIRLFVNIFRFRRFRVLQTLF